VRPERHGWLLRVCERRLPAKLARTELAEPGFPKLNSIAKTLPVFSN